MTSDPPTERRTQQKPVHAGQNDPRTVFVCPRHLLLRYSFTFLHNQVERRVKKKKKKSGMFTITITLSLFTPGGSHPVVTLV